MHAHNLPLTSRMDLKSRRVAKADLTGQPCQTKSNEHRETPTRDALQCKATAQSATNRRGLEDPRFNRLVIGTPNLGESVQPDPADQETHRVLGARVPVVSGLRAEDIAQTLAVPNK